MISRQKSIRSGIVIALILVLSTLFSGFYKSTPAYAAVCTAGGDLTKCETQDQCETASGVWADGKCSEDTSDAGSKCSDATQGFGWVICPGVNMFSSAIDGIIGAITKDLNWTLLAEGGEAAERIRSIWQSILNIANIAFAIAFIVMIYSMATSTGVSNYHIKKILPRLLIAVVTMNLSFYICAAAVDLSNIAGTSIKTLIESQMIGEPKNLLIEVVGIIALGVAGIIAAILLLPALIISLLVILLCIYGRQVGLILLVVLSPLAFACLLLPNTKNWFKKWLDYFTKLLLVFPMFNAVWAACHLVANIMVTTTDPGIFTIVIETAAGIIPMCLIIPMFKLSGGLMGKITDKVNGIGSKAGSKVKPVYKQGLKNSDAAQRIGQHYSNAAAGLQSSLRNSRFSAINSLARSPFLNKQVAHAGSESARLDKEAMESANNYLGRLTPDDAYNIATKGGRVVGHDANGREIIKDADSHLFRAAVEKSKDAFDDRGVDDMLIQAARLSHNDPADNLHTRRDAANMAIGLRKGGLKPGDMNNYIAMRNRDYDPTKVGAAAAGTGPNWGVDTAAALQQSLVSKVAKLSPEKISAMSKSSYDYNVSQIKASGDQAALHNFVNMTDKAINNEKLRSGMARETLDSAAGTTLKFHLDQVESAIASNNASEALMEIKHSGQLATNSGHTTNPDYATAKQRAKTQSAYMAKENLVAAQASISAGNVNQARQEIHQVFAASQLTDDPRALPINQVSVDLSNNIRKHPSDQNMIGRDVQYAINQAASSIGRGARGDDWGK